MKIFKVVNRSSVTISLLTILAISQNALVQAQQKIGFGVHADPGVSWLSSDINAVKNDGVRPCFSFGLTFNKYFTPNYSFSTGISIINASGRLTSSVIDTMEFTNFKSVVFPGKPVIYRIQYITVPVGIKLQTNQIGYLTFFTDVGLDPKIVIGSKADIPILNLSGENAKNEVNKFNLSYHITAGIEYSLGGTTAILFGLNFDNNFLDITKDNRKQPKDNISHKILSLRLGINF